jgi:hypothetical protein
MKKLFTKSFIRALIITIISALIIVGGIYAYETLWSRKANITIEPPTGTGEWELEGVTADGGTWNAATGTWTVSLQRAEWPGPGLIVGFRNAGDDAITFKPYINGQELSNWVATGVYVQTTGDLSQLPAGESGSIRFSVGATADAEPGILPEIQLEIRTD